MKRLVLDLDNTISITSHGDYINAVPVEGVKEKIIEYKELGFEIVIYTSRNMRTYSGNIGKINSNTLPIIIEWLNRYHIPYDEIIVGKPWCGNEGFYVDDKAIRPDEFCSLPYSSIKKLIGIN